MNTTVTLRPVSDSDADFLLRVYASTRAEELAKAPWTDAQKDDFVRMQFEAQRRFYADAFEGAEHCVIECGGVGTGRFYVHRGKSDILIVDIAILPEFRGRGIGTKLIGDLKKEGLPLRIHVEHFNRALALYEREGFVKVGDEGLYFEMLWTPK